MIRTAAPHDIEALMGLGRQMHAEGAFNVHAMDEQKVRQAMLHCIDKQFASVSAGPDGLDGMLLGQASELWYSRAKCASDVLFYVRPDRRGSITAVRLVQAFVEWAHWTGAAEVQIAQSSGVRVEELHRLMTGMSFGHVGGVYKWRIS